MGQTKKKDRILVVDDDEAITELVSQMLIRAGYSAHACTDPYHALYLFSRASERFDAVIVDEIMPGMKGTDLTRQLLQIKHDIPVLLVTGHADMISLEQIRSSGVYAVLMKPISRERLQEVLRAAFRKRKGRPEFA
jgi:DNA-binding NtrC family response regulator